MIAWVSLEPLDVELLLAAACGLGGLAVFFGWLLLETKWAEEREAAWKQSRRAVGASSDTSGGDR